MFFWNVNSPLTILLITLSSPFQRSPRDTKVLSRCLKCPWIFQRLADVNSCLVPIKRRGSLDRTAPNPPHVQPQQGSHFSPTEEKDPSCFFSAPWSTLELSSWWPPAAAPICGSPAPRTPLWRRVRRISPWKPNRKKTWWDFRREVGMDCSSRKSDDSWTAWVIGL